MSPFQKPELIAFVYALLPGFVTAWIFYGLSPNPKPSSFERVVQALVFTLLAEFIAQVVRFLSIGFGSSFGSFGAWTDDVHFAWKVFAAILMGFVAVVVVQNNYFRRIPNWISSKTSYPSEWFSAFIRTKSYVYLHLVGERRIRGWPEEWPDDPSKGHFVLMNAAWILDDNTRVPLAITERILIPVKEVERVEFEKETITEEEAIETESATKVVMAYNEKIESEKSKEKEKQKDKSNGETNDRDRGDEQSPPESNDKFLG